MRGKRDRQQLRNFKHKGKHKIGCYPKSLLILTAYQVQGRRTIIIIPVKYQAYGRNVTYILLKSSWHTHLKHSKPYIFNLEKVMNPPYGFLVLSSLPHQSSKSLVICFYIGYLGNSKPRSID